MSLKFLLDQWCKHIDFMHMHPLIDHKTPLQITGLEGSQRNYLLAALQQTEKRPLLVVTPDALSAVKVFEDLQAFLPEEEIILVNGRTLMTSGVLGQSGEIAQSRMIALEKISRLEKIIIIMPAEAFVERLMPAEIRQGRKLKLKVGDIQSRDEIISQLISGGYQRESITEKEGQFSARGEIIDIYPPGWQTPVRLTLFGDEIESIRRFSQISQRSEGTQEQVVIYPAGEIILTPEVKKRGLARIKVALAESQRKLRENGDPEIADKLFAETQNHLRLLENKVILNDSLQLYFPFFYDYGETWLNYLPSSGLVVLNDLDRVQEALFLQMERTSSIIADLWQKGQFLSAGIPVYWEIEELTGKSRQSLLYFNLFQRSSGNLTGTTRHFAGRNAPGFYGQAELWQNELAHWQKEGYKVYLFCATPESGKALLEQLESLEQEKSPGELSVLPEIIIGSLHNGFLLPFLRIAALTEESFYPRRQKKKKRIGSQEGLNIRHYRDLNPGDYVVHEQNGIGKFLGLETLEIEGIRKDFLHISYYGEDKLFISIDQTGLIRKYIGAEGRAPRLHRLGNGNWQKTKAKVRESVREIAEELLEIYAARQAISGRSFSPDHAWQAEFAAYFPYEETPDQLRSVMEVSQDLASTKPMDRLLCGDVGFGKTEVAMRAAFNVVAEGKQVAILVPTTILAQQHYRTFRERFAPFSFRVEQLSRFLSATRQKEIVADANLGKIDILIGTHRLLSKDVRFKDLGLIVLDEEHRFGVRHKEKLKKFRVNVDVLALTATPIPRTLHMSLTGVRDLSIIETPPENRFPVQTYVAEYSDSLIRDAIRRELARGGQVFYVYNRVETIERWARQVAALVPEARVRVAHGQMPETQLAEIMGDFIDKEFDVLISTTIIEAGLDIPNVNTLIIYDADCFGLAQLYQMRGRVGRSTRLAYAYLTFRREKSLSAAAEKRLQAVKDFAELGSGLKIALRDLEIRGAGNILGAEQHGFIAEVGFEMYCQMLTEAVQAHRGVKVVSKQPPRLDLKMDAYLPGSYILDLERKIEIYQRIYASDNITEIEEIKDELTDRFGAPPTEVCNLLGIARLRVLSEELPVASIRRENGQVIISFNKDYLLNTSLLMAVERKFPGRLVVARSAGVTLKLKPEKPESCLQETEQLLSLTKEIVALP